MLFFVLMRLSQGQHFAVRLFRLRQFSSTFQQDAKLVPAVCIIRVKLHGLSVGKQSLFGVVPIRQCAKVAGGSGGLLVRLPAFRLLAAQHFSKDGLRLGRVALRQFLQGRIDACRRRASLGQSSDSFSQGLDLLILGLQLPLQRGKQLLRQLAGCTLSMNLFHAASAKPNTVTHSPSWKP